MNGTSGLATTLTVTNKLTALTLLQPATEEYPVCVTRARVLQQDWAVTVLCLPPVTVACLLLTQRQERLGGDQVGTVQEHTGRLQHAAAGQNLHKHTKQQNPMMSEGNLLCRTKENVFLL